MFTTLINELFSASLFITGGHVLSTNFKLHHYIDKDYKALFHLKNKKIYMRRSIISIIAISVKRI